MFGIYNSSLINSVGGFSKSTIAAVVGVSAQQEASPELQAQQGAILANPAAAAEATKIATIQTVTESLANEPLISQEEIVESVNTIVDVQTAVAPELIASMPVSEAQAALGANIDTLQKAAAITGGAVFGAQKEVVTEALEKAKDTVSSITSTAAGAIDIVKDVASNIASTVGSVLTAPFSIFGNKKSEQAPVQGPVAPPAGTPTNTTVSTQGENPANRGFEYSHFYEPHLVNNNRWQVNSDVGWREFDGLPHDAIDTQAFNADGSGARNPNLLAMVSGTIETDTESIWGKRVWLKGDDGNTYRYGHLDSFNVKTGDRVSAGDIIGKQGGTNAPGLKEYPDHLDLGIFDTATGELLDPITMFPSYFSGIKVYRDESRSFELQQ